MIYRPLSIMRLGFVGVEKRLQAGLIRALL